MIVGDWLLTPQRVAIHQPTRTAVVADLHLGYDAARIGAGDAIPLRSLAEILAPLGQLGPDLKLVVAGDLFERRVDRALLGEFQTFLSSAGWDWIAWIAGNHDRGFDSATDAPVVAAGFAVGEWRVHHGHEEILTDKIVIGHWHPAWRVGGRTCPCFALAGDRLYLPAYSHDAAGRSIRGEPRFQGCRVFPIVGTQVQEARLRSEWGQGIK